MAIGGLPDTQTGRLLHFGGSYSMPKPVGHSTPASLHLAGWRQTGSSPPAAMLTAKVTEASSFTPEQLRAPSRICFTYGASTHLRGVDYDSGVALPAKPVHIRGWPDWLPRARPGHPAAPAVISKADTPWQRSDSGSGWKAEWPL